MLLTKIKAGSVLVAEPAIIGDISFQRSVVMIANHDEKGSVGFIMNKPLEPHVIGYCSNNYTGISNF